MTLIGKTLSAQRKTHPHATLSTTGPTDPGLVVKHTLRGAKFPLCLSTVAIIKINNFQASDFGDRHRRMQFKVGWFFFCDKGDLESEQNTVTLETVMVRSCHCRNRTPYVQHVSSHCTE